MANGTMYPTGLGSTGSGVVDFSPVSNYFNSFIEQQIKDINQKRVKAAEYEKRVLNALSTDALPEMSGKLRDFHQKKIEEYKTEITNRLQKSGGRPTLDDEKFIEEQGVKLQNNMLKDQNNLQKWAFLQAQTRNFNFMSKTVDAQKYMNLLTDYKDRLDRGEDPGPPDYILTESYRQPSLPEYLTANYAPFIKNFDVTGNLRVSGNKILITTETDEANARESIKRMIEQDPVLSQRLIQADGVIDEQALEAQVDEVLPYFIKRTGEERLIPGYASRAGGRGVRNVDFTETVYGDTETKEFIPVKATNVSRTLGKVVNEDTGQSETLTKPLTSTFVGVDAENDKLLFRTYDGGVAKRDGAILYGDAATTNLGYDVQKLGAMTLNEMKDKASDILPKAAKLEKGSKDATVKNVKAEKRNGDIVLSGEVVYSKRIKKGRKFVGIGTEDKFEKTTKPISITYKPLVDPRGETTYSLPLTPENMEFVSNEVKDLRVNGRTIDDFIARRDKKKPKETNVFTKQFLLSRGYTEQQIDAAVKAGKIKLR